MKLIIKHIFFNSVGGQGSVSYLEIFHDGFMCVIDLAWLCGTD